MACVRWLFARPRRLWHAVCWLLAWALLAVGLCAACCLVACCCAARVAGPCVLLGRCVAACCPAARVLLAAGVLLGCLPCVCCLVACRCAAGVLLAGCLASWLPAAWLLLTHPPLVSAAVSILCGPACPIKLHLVCGQGSVLSVTITFMRTGGLIGWEFAPKCISIGRYGHRQETSMSLNCAPSSTCC